MNAPVISQNRLQAETQDEQNVRFLFTHQNFPGQFPHIIRHLGRNPENEIVFISEVNESAIDNVRRVLYRIARAPEVRSMPGLHEYELGLLRAEAVARAARNLKALGFIPDVIIGHHGWGELLDIKDVYPTTPVLGYFEFFYHTKGFDVDFDPEFPLEAELLPVVRQKNAVNLMALNLNEHGQTPTDFQLKTYPSWARPQINLIREGVNLKHCRPDPGAARRPLEINGHIIAPEKKLVTYVARNLEPYRGFHSFMRALPRLLAERPDVEVAIVGGDSVSYGRLPGKSFANWREALLAELRDRLDLSRAHFLGQVTYPLYLKLLQRSDAHVYLTYPFVASWSLREALAIGCPIVGSDTQPVREFIKNGETGLLTSCLDPDAITGSIHQILTDRELSNKLRRNARREAEAHLDLDVYLNHYERIIADVARF